MASSSFTITRGSLWDESYDVYYKIGGAPLELGDGVFYGNFVIQPWETSIVVTITTSADADLGIMVGPVQAREVNVFATRSAYGWSFIFSEPNFSGLLALIEDDI